ncbi:MAG: protein translocase subunit SecD, partial [Deltaproteobacteria bacterium]|nr:protein translocase subunit SecD [Deltaproteobacteria bacterium]
ATELEDTLLDKLINYNRVERVGDSIEVDLPAGEVVNWNEEPFSRLTSSLSRETNGPNGFKFSLPSSEADRIQKNAVSQALEVIRNRVDSLGVSEPSIQRQGETNLLIQLPGLKDRDAAIRTIGTQAVLEFYLVEDSRTPGTMDPSKNVVKFMEKRDPILHTLISREPYVLQRRAVLTGDTVRDARVNISQQNNMPTVSVSFDSIGKERFARITRQSVNRRLAIVLDDKVQSAPVIREEIAGGEAQISGQFSMAEATELSIVLRSGSLPAPIIIREERTVGATLGEDSIRQGLLSTAVGGLLVVVFMLFYYKVSGIFADLALVFNLLLLLGVLASFQATLTLPGIAGIVLTLGMAVDANVLIFERIREEIKNTGNIRNAVAAGFDKAFGTILDSNLTTLFGAFALLAFGSGPVKGFAVTLSIGILASMFTSIVVTRILFELFYLRRPHLDKLSI